MISYFHQFIGPKDFYKKTFLIAIPLALQMLLQNCMSIIDMMMVASIGMVTAVGNTSQILMLHDGISWGIISGIAMFASQFYGAKQKKNLQKAFVLGLLLTCLNAIFWTCITLFFGKQLLYFYLPDVEVLHYSMLYVRIMLFYLIPFAINNIFTTIYRCTQQAKVTLFSAIVGAISNVSLNYIFIFILKLGIEGAALGTVLAQVIMMVFNFSYAVITKQEFIMGIQHSFKIEVSFLKPIIEKMLPLICNETLFGFGMTMFVKAFGMLGTQSMDAYYVSNQIYNMFMFVVNGYGSAVSILIGARLGSGNIRLAKQEAKYQVGLGFILGSIMLISVVILAKPMVHLFGYSSGPIYVLAVGMVYVLSIKVFMRMFNFMMFSTLRAGGDAKILNLLDSGLVYGVGLTLAFTSVCIFKIENIVLVLLICQFEQFVRLILTGLRYRTNIWAKDLTKLVSN